MKRKTVVLRKPNWKECTSKNPAGNGDQQGHVRPEASTSRKPDRSGRPTQAPRHKARQMMPPGKTPGDAEEPAEGTSAKVPAKRTSDDLEEEIVVLRRENARLRISLREAESSVKKEARKKRFYTQIIERALDEPV